MLGTGSCLVSEVGNVGGWLLHPRLWCYEKPGWRYDASAAEVRAHNPSPTTYLKSLLHVPRSCTGVFIPFSAFWLRSSVVSVLISLISDMGDIVPHDINLIFAGAPATSCACTVAVQHGHGIALQPWPCTPLPPHTYPSLTIKYHTHALIEHAAFVVRSLVRDATP